MNRYNGKELGGIDHLRQSIVDILTTPLCSRVMLREYGSRLFDLIDAPSNRETIIEIYAATAEAILRWEPRFKLDRVLADKIEPGKVTLTLQGTYVPDGTHIVIEGVVV